MYIELIGYIAMLLVAISFLMKEMKWLRWVNMCGAAVFVLYGVLLGALPVIFLNLFIGGVNGWRLISDKPEVVYSNS